LNIAPYKNLPLLTVYISPRYCCVFWITSPTGTSEANGSISAQRYLLTSLIMWS